MAKQTIWIEKTKFKSMLDSIEVEIQEIEQTAVILRNLVEKFNRAIIYEEKS
tara:strand:+ start:445 stop:600 length:156 start_codon:yes stop_codon:yes gene_type:complete